MPSYQEHGHWQRYQEFFPSGMRVTPDTAPLEEWWRWRGLRVHLDRMPRPSAPAKVIALHGAGGNGRMLAPFTRLPALSGLESVAPDLPGYGLSESGGSVSYSDWVDCAADLVRVERERDGRPIVLVGASLGGMLAYSVAASGGVSGVAGVVATALLDPRQPAVRSGVAAYPWLGRVAPPVLWGLPSMLDRVRVPIRWLVNMSAMSNRTRLNTVVAADPLGGGNWVSLRFLRTFLRSSPPVEPERFTGCPVLLAHPAEDQWTPLALSSPFFQRLRVPRRLALLRGAGHLPVEESGLADLDRALRDFLDELGLG